MLKYLVLCCLLLSGCLDNLGEYFIRGWQEEDRIAKLTNQEIEREKEICRKYEEKLTKLPFFQRHKAYPDEEPSSFVTYGWHDICREYKKRDQKAQEKKESSIDD